MFVSDKSAFVPRFCADTAAFSVFVTQDQILSRRGLPCNKVPLRDQTRGIIRCHFLVASDRISCTSPLPTGSEMQGLRTAHRYSIDIIYEYAETPGKRINSHWTRRPLKDVRRQDFTFQILRDEDEAPRHFWFLSSHPLGFPILEANKHCPILAPPGPDDWPKNVGPGTSPSQSSCS